MSTSYVVCHVYLNFIIWILEGEMGFIKSAKRLTIFCSKLSESNDQWRARVSSHSFIIWEALKEK